MIRGIIEFIKLQVNSKPVLKAVPAMTNNGMQQLLKRRKAGFDPRITPGIRF